jgi:ATP-dependent helicase/nuclease subunit A
MYNDDEVIVVDYKFGRANEDYKNQVKGYIDLISQMTEFRDKKFKGYIFYINAQNPKESRVEQCY